MKARRCKVKGCDKPAKDGGKHGDPTMGKTARGAPKKFLEEKVYNYKGNKCLIWPFRKSTNGYAVWANKNNKTTSVPRMVCEHFNGPPPTPAHEAAHSCGNGKYGCVTPKHLRWATHIENEADKIVHGTHTRGERSWHAKLTEKDVRKIRTLKDKMFQREIAKKFGVCQQAIAQIFKGESWAWLQ